MKNTLQRFLHNQSGLTLIELLVALILGAILIIGVSATYIQIVKGTNNSNNHMLALRQVQTAGYWVSNDTQMASDFDFVVDPWKLTIYRYDIGGIEYRSEYQISEAGVMTRAFYIAGVLSGTGLIAEHLVLADTVYDLTLEHGVEFRVTATVFNMSETRTYRILSRLKK